MSADRNGYIGRSPGDSSVIIASQTFEPTGIQTNFTFASGYTPGYIDVYLNGSRLVYANDYTATDGSIVGLTTFANSGDVIDCVAYKAFNLANVVSNTAGGSLEVGTDLTVNGNATIVGDTTATDINATGIVTASSFSGDGSALTGVASTDNIITGVAVTIGGILRVTDTTQSTSTTTGSVIVSGGVGIAKSLNVGGNISVGGTLTYEDVTNVDSVGLITARSGIQFGVAGVGGTITGAGAANIIGISTFESNVEFGKAGVGGTITGAGAVNIIGISTFESNVEFGKAGVGGTIRANGDTTLVGVLTATKISVNENSAFNDADEYLLVKNTGAACNLSVVGGTGNHSSLNLGDTDDFNIQRIKSDHTDNSLQLFTADYQRVHIDSTGRVGINTTYFSDAREALRISAPQSQAETFITIKSPSDSGSSQIFFGDADFNEGRIDYDHSTDTMGLYTNDTERFLVNDHGVKVTGICTVSQGTDLDGYKVEEGKYDTNALNGEFNFEFENGHIQTHTGSTAGTYFPDFRVSSSQSLDSVMDVGDVVSATLIVTASNTAHYCTTGIKIDNSTSNVTIEWIGSAAPTAGKGAGYDIYSFTIQKTAATPAYLVIVNATDAG